MRRKDREMPAPFALEVADRCAYAALSTVNADGTPYCVPISIVRDGEWVAFHCALAGRKTENMRKQNQVCIACVGEMEVLEETYSIAYESAVISGPAEEVTEAAEKIRLLRLLCERYTPSNMARFDAAIAESLAATAIWRVHIRHITGKRREKR